MKKSIKLIFCGKKIRPVAVVEKVPSTWKNLCRKKIQLICTDKIYKTIGGNFFEINWSRNIWLQLIFWFRKTVLHHKIINKTVSTKNQENSAHHFGDNYLSNHLVQFLQDRIKPWRVGTLRVHRLSLFFNKNC